MGRKNNTLNKIQKNKKKKFNKRLSKKRQRQKTKNKDKKDKERRREQDQKDQTHQYSCLKHVYIVCILYKHVNCHTIAKIN